MSYNLSACVFIRDCFKGAFCLFESMTTLMPLVDEFIVMDLGSADGTLEALKQVESGNPKVKLVQGNFDKIDANVFATLANDLIAMCENDNVLYYQADEIWHEDLVALTRQRFDRGEFDLNFWRVQLRENFQKIKWFPHFVHRVGKKGNFNFVVDGMNTDRHLDAKTVHDKYDSSWFIRWGDEYRGVEGTKHPSELPTNEMILDVSLVGAFLENIPERRRMHTPFWHEAPTNMPSDEDNMLIDDWMIKERNNPNWKETVSPFNIPAIMRWHLGRSKYELRPDLLRALIENRPYEVGDKWRRFH